MVDSEWPTPLASCSMTQNQCHIHLLRVPVSESLLKLISKSLVHQSHSLASEPLLLLN